MASWCPPHGLLHRWYLVPMGLSPIIAIMLSGIGLTTTNSCRCKGLWGYGGVLAISLFMKQNAIGNTNSVDALYP
jgi:hypothetical protein